MAQLVGFQIWADQTIIEILDQLDQDLLTKDLGNGNSVKMKIAHIVSVLDMWLQRISGNSVSEIPDYTDNKIEDLIEHWKSLDETFYEKATELLELDKPVTYSNTGGEEYQNTPEELINHLVNHTTYHRGQIATLLRMQDVELENTDFIYYTRRD